MKILLGDDLITAFGGDEFVVGDVGDMIKPNHIDLYWGEDDPSPHNMDIPNGLADGIKKGYVFRVILMR